MRPVWVRDLMPEYIYSAIKQTENGDYIKRSFYTLEDAERFARNSNSVVVCELKKDIRFIWLKKLANVGVFLLSVGILSVIAWGWIDVLINAGLI